MSRARVDPYGELLLLLAAPSVLPGVGSVLGTLAGLAAVALGLQLAWGRNEPWLPGTLRARLGHSRLALRLRMWIQRRLRPWAAWQVPPYPRALAGCTAAWSGFLLSLPLAVVPFANIIPGLSIGMVGACLMARRPLFGWIATLLSAGFTGVLLVLGGTVLAALRRLLPGG